MEEEILCVFSYSPSPEELVCRFSSYFKETRICYKCCTLKKKNLKEGRNFFLLLE